MRFRFYSTLSLKEVYKVNYVLEQSNKYRDLHFFIHTSVNRPG